MTIMNREVYEALKAAESVAAYDTRFAELDKNMTLIKWMVGFNLAVSLAALYRLIA